MPRFWIRLSKFENWWRLRDRQAVTARRPVMLLRCVSWRWAGSWRNCERLNAASGGLLKTAAPSVQADRRANALFLKILPPCDRHVAGVQNHRSRLVAEIPFKKNISARTLKKL